MFVKEKFIAELKKLASFQAKEYSSALKDVFIKMDELLKSPQGQKDILKHTTTE